MYNFLSRCDNWQCGKTLLAGHSVWRMQLNIMNDNSTVKWLSGVQTLDKQLLLWKFASMYVCRLVWNPFCEPHPEQPWSDFNDGAILKPKHLISSREIPAIRFSLVSQSQRSAACTLFFSFFFPILKTCHKSSEEKQKEPFVLYPS